MNRQPGRRKRCLRHASSLDWPPSKSAGWLRSLVSISFVGRLSAACCDYPLTTTRASLRELLHSDGRGDEDRVVDRRERRRVQQVEILDLRESHSRMQRGCEDVDSLGHRVAADHLRAEQAANGLLGIQHGRDRLVTRIVAAASVVMRDGTDGIDALARCAWSRQAIERRCGRTPARSRTSTCR